MDGTSVWMFAFHRIVSPTLARFPGTRVWDAETGSKSTSWRKVAMLRSSAHFLSKSLDRVVTHRSMVTARSRRLPMYKRHHHHRIIIVSSSAS